MYTSFFRLVSRTHGRCQNLHDGFLQNLNRHGISLLSKELSCLLPDPCDDSFPSPSVCFAFEWDAGEDDRPFCLWPLPLFPVAYMSLLWNTVHVPSTENTLPLSSQRRLSFLFDSSSFRTMKFRVLTIWSIWSFTAVFKRKWFGSLLRAVSSSYNANTVWSWTEFCNFDLYNPSRIISEGISLTGNSAWSHLMSKSWTSSFCKLVANKVESPCTASQAPFAREYS